MQDEPDGAVSHAATSPESGSRTEGLFVEPVEDLADALWRSFGQQANITLQTWLMAETMVRELTYATSTSGISFHQSICERAYYLWEAAGRQHGRALDYWLAAERLAWESLAPRSPPASAEKPTASSTFVE